MSSSFDDDKYQPPEVLRVVHGLFDFLRREYSSDFSAFYAASSVEEDVGTSSVDYRNYRAGLIFVGCFVASFAVIWSIVLLVLKCKGSAVGCASGHVFRKRTTRKNKSGKKIPRSGSSTTAMGGRTTLPSGSAADGSGRGDEGTNNKCFDFTAVGIESLNSSLQSENDDDSSMGLCNPEREKETGSSDQSSEDSTSEGPTKRERRTQSAFIVFGLVTLFSVPLALVFSFAPLMDTANGSNIYLEGAREVISEVETSFDTIAGTTESVAMVVNQIPLDYGTICPEINSTDLEKLTGFDLEIVLSRISADYNSAETEMDSLVHHVADSLARLTDIIDFLEAMYDEIEDYNWLVPGILLGLSSLTAVVMFGVILAWKRESNQRFQNILSFGVLPLIIALSLTCWSLAVATAIASAIGGDACMAKSGNGSPDRTFQAILEGGGSPDAEGLDGLFTAYAGGACQRGEDPTEELSKMENSLEEISDYIWNHLSLIDSVGRSGIEAACRGETEVDTALEIFIDSASDLAMLLTSIRRSVDSATRSLRCERIAPLYTAIVHESLCTAVAGSFAWGYLFFLLLGISTMSTISLRASWSYEVDEGKIYDESEVAENMIVDEHEEYLAYISKYKHEWEEYGGFDDTLQAGDEGRQKHNDKEISGVASLSYSDSVSVSIHEPYDEASGISSSAEETEMQNTEGSSKLATVNSYLQGDEPFDPYHSTDDDSRTTTSPASTDVSFLSLPDDPSGLSQGNDERSGITSSATANSVTPLLPPPLLLRTMDKATEDIDGIPPSESECDEEEVDGIPPPISPFRARDPDNGIVRPQSIRSSCHNGANSLLASIISFASSCEKSNDGGDEPNKYHDDKPARPKKSTNSRLGGLSPDSGISAQSPALSTSSVPISPVDEQDITESVLGSSFEDMPVSTVGKPVILKSPPPSKRTLSSVASPGGSQGSVQFQIFDDDPPSSRVQQHVDLFSKKAALARPSTPPRLNPPKMRDLAAKFDSPSSPKKSL